MRAYMRQQSADLGLYKVQTLVNKRSSLTLPFQGEDGNQVSKLQAPVKLPMEGGDRAHSSRYRI